MAQLRSLLQNVQVEVAQRRRACGRNRQHAVAQGEKCLAFKGMQRPRSYCKKCAQGMIAEARRELDEMARDLGLSVAAGE